MTAKQIVNIVLRLLGALWALSAIISLPDLLQFATAADDQTRRLTLGNALSTLVWLIIGAAMFFKSEQIASALFPDTDRLSISATSDELQQVGFSLLSVYFGIGAIATLAGLIYVAIRNEPMDESRLGYLWRLNPEHLVSAAAQLVVCIALFFGSKGLSRLWRRVRA